MATLETPTVLSARRTFPWLSEFARQQIREYAPTVLTELAVMGCQILVYKLAAHYLGNIGFSEYALVRRTVTLMMPIPILGLSIGLPRYISYSKGRNDSEAADRYYGGTLWCAGFGAAICFVLINSFSGVFGYLFFGSRNYAILSFPMSLMILGLCAHTVACGYFRGHMQLNRANALQFINLACLPILAFVFAHGSLRTLLLVIGSFWIAISTIALCFTPLGAIAKSGTKEIRQLLKYGIQRIPGDFILGAIFTLPATFIAHLQGVREAGFVAFGISVVSMIGGIFAPASLVLLPKATLLLAEGARKKLWIHLRPILTTTAVASVMMSALIWWLVPNLIRLYLGPGFETVVPIVRFLVLGALPYSLYLILRNLVDAYHEHGVTAVILSVGLLVLIVGGYVGRGLSDATLGILSAFLLTQVVIAALSGIECYRILSDTNNQRWSCRR